MRNRKATLTALAVGLASFAGLAAAQTPAPVGPAADKSAQQQLARRVASDTPEMVTIPAGSFTMGSPSSEAGRNTDEGPQREVKISHRFALGKYDVTVAEFRRFADETGYKAGGDCYADFKNEGQWEKTPQANWNNTGFEQNSDQPVVCVSWSDAQASAAWISKKTGKAYRLPSEAEWEYAARAHTTGAYSFGADVNAGCAYMNAADTTAKRKFRYWTALACDDGFIYTSPVGAFRPNAFGLYDMLGNVRQWVEDCYADSYGEDQPSDGSAYNDTPCSDRVIRGGSWIDVAPELRSARRDNDSPTGRTYNLGFRLAMTLP